MAAIAETLAQAKAYHRAGQLALAEPLYRQVLQADPAHGEAYYLLGALCQALGKLNEAAACLQQAVQLSPSHAEAHNHLGVVLAQQGKLDQAIVSFEQALRLRPAFADAANNLRKALAPAQEAAATPPTPPPSAQSYSDQGALLLQQGKLEEALASFRQALWLKPDFADAHNNLGVALLRQGKPDEALDCLRRAVQIKPDYAQAINNLGLLLMQQGNLDGAVATFQQFLRLEPDDAETHGNLARALRYLGKLEEAVACYRRALELRPDHSATLNSLGTVLSEQGKQQEAMACYRRALELSPDSVAAHNNCVFSQQHRPGITLAELASVHAEWDRRHAAPLRAAWQPHGNIRDPQRRLRLGFVSGDLREHALTYSLLPVLEALDRQACEIVCYSNNQHQDNMTGRIRAAATLWREIHALDDDAVATQVRADQIDILFDLDGHTGDNRLLLFARKPAPIQVTWLGYVGTTGLSAMDYLIADRWEVPEGMETHYRERVLRLPDGFLCYQAPADLPPVEPLPALKHPRVTFGSFNKPEKVNRSVVALWADILRGAPETRLLLKYSGFGDQGTCGYFAEMFAACGIPRDRLELQGHSPHAEHLRAYNQVDIALDPSPYAGGATTLEALWMGVPVITYPGETFAGRHSLSHLSNMGFTETIARDWSHYAELAVELAHDLPRLAKWRAELRPRMARSPLCDGPRFATNLMNVLRGVWRQWCEGQGARDGG